MKPAIKISEDVVPPTEKLENADLARLLDIIDKLREFGVSEDISLPQIVVVGDQSSGKSSLLEALTGIRFPIASTLCTRFATQISFRKSPDSKITVTIIPAKSSDAARKAELRAFSDTVVELTPERFSEIMEKAGDLMGLPKAGETVGVDDAEKRFSDDVLRIELCGPSRSHFSVVDVPGLFQSATMYQNEKDLEMVENLAKSYIEDERTIILAVASSLNETANQKVFRLASAAGADPEGVRTVGVLTKPDAIQPGDEGRVIDTALNKVTVLHHGWFIVRNRSTDEVKRNISNAERLENEANLFKKDPWRTLPRDRVGVPALEKFLQRLLFDHVRKEFPKMVQEIDAMMEDCERELGALGQRRETSDEQRGVLIGIATDFQISARNAMMGLYEMDSLEQKSLRVRMHIQNLNAEFSDTVWRSGHTKSFDGGSSPPSSGPSPVPSAGLNDMAKDDSKTIYEWIRKAYRESRGPELPGMVNPGVVQLLFRMQTGKWERLAREHIIRVRAQIERFVADLLRLKCPDDSLRHNIWMKMRALFAAVYKKADRELQMILQDEREGILITYNHYYSDNLDRARKGRIAATIRRAQGDNGANALGVALGVLENIDPEEQAVAEIYDVLHAYYKVARKRFVDCVALQVVERHYLGAKGPVRVFSPAYVGRLSPEELNAVGGEDQVVIEKRKRLEAKLERLQGAQEISSSYW
ncbi:P-loop containing nucleoside triphosphate hydrolase protein [Morchella conica CCBAS932]|uniref:P-loop containing nucleoside triphosphate hydrolase protein n=1 Tax=Morchella conica CCBAS932 TaxID=1392247 RepID=A0A3N4KDV2_9PEZI|nr:P-loop containing nucleoside triphosphate hydrolase protein [Morchella conica CCBAS932]